MLEKETPGFMVSDSELTEETGVLEITETSHILFAIKKVLVAL